MNVVILKYNAGNVCSVRYALERIGVNPIVSDDPSVINAAEKVIFPGVGEASTAMDYLRKKGLDTLIKSLRQPVLGICLGMQLMCRFSEENNTECLGIFEQDVKYFQFKDLKVPQIGWNSVTQLKSALFKDIDEGAFVYFVHGYYAELSARTTAVTNYGLNYSAALQKDNFYAVQFHPEKSGLLGEAILRNFIKL